MVRTREASMHRWVRGDTLLDSPVLGHAVRMVGEDEFREQGLIAATAPAGDNVIFLGRREKVDLEILEVTLQNQSGSIVNCQLHASGYALSGLWQISGTNGSNFWSHPGFILMPGHVLYLRTQTAGQWAFEIRWRLYYGRSK